MLPDPLHPVIVHFPIVLVAFLPVVAVIALVLIQRGARARGTWAGVVALAAVLSLSAWVSVETGEEQEEAVERVVPEDAIHEHEEAAEAFLLLTLGGLLVLGVGLAPGRVGRVGRFAGAVVTLGLLAAGVNVGHTGGELVYTHGAAQAYVTSGRADRDGARRDDDERDDDHDDERDERQRRR